MKHDTDLREQAERVFYERNRDSGRNFAQAERRRDPDYLAAIDAAFELRRAVWDYEIKMRQFLLL